MATISTLEAGALEELVFLTQRVMADFRPARTPSSLLYVFSNTPDNECSSFERAALHERAGETAAIGICSGETAHGYAGFEHSLRQLQTLGVDACCVVPISVEGAVNTYTEAQALARHCRTMAGDLEITAPPFHIVRAFMTTITALRNEGVRHRVFARMGTPVRWGDVVTHSQGTLRATRADLLASELRRIDRYRDEEFGRLATAREVLEYLSWRDLAQ